MKITMTEARIIKDLKSAKITWGMQLEMARKYNQGDEVFARLGANSKQRAKQIVDKINNMDTALIEKITKIAEKHNLL